MRRREVLASAVGLGAATVGGTRVVRGHQDATTSGPDEFAPLATLPLDGAREAVVGPDGTTAHLAVEGGFAAVDVSDPSAPTLLAERRDLLADDPEGPMRDVQDVAVDGDRLLVVGPAHPGSAGPRAALLFDVSDPSAPERLAVHRTDYPIHNAALRDGHAYLTAGDEADRWFEVVDVSAGATPVSRWSPVDADDAWASVPVGLRPLHDLTVRDGLAYCAVWDAGTWIVDVSDPADPVALGRVGGRPPDALAAVEDVARASTELPGNHHSCALDEREGLLAVGREAWDADGDGAGGPGGVTLHDVSDPSRPEPLGRVDPPPTEDPTRSGTWTTAHNLDLRAGLLYSAWYQGGVRIHDVTDPSAPRAVAAWRDAEAARFWTAVRAAEAVVAPSMGVGAADAALVTFPAPEPVRPTEESGDATTSNDVTASPGLGGFGLGAGALGAGLAGWLAARRR